MNLDRILIAMAATTALAGAARSTWSPCGLSMLSSLTPFGERSRGHRYGVTAAWFVLGGTAGGATLGLVALGLAAGGSAAGIGSHRVVAASIAAALALVGSAVDAGLFGDVLPLMRRQVDDRWLSRYRGWVYATGFGWQIGTGVTTYMMTSAIFVFVALGASSGLPLPAFFVATGFGAARGAAVLLTRRASNPAALRVLHRKLERAEEPVRWIVIAAQAVAALVAGAFLGPMFPLVCVALALVAVMTLRNQVTAGVAGK